MSHVLFFIAITVPLFICRIFGFNEGKKTIKVYWTVSILIAIYVTYVATSANLKAHLHVCHDRQAESQKTMLWILQNIEKGEVSEVKEFLALYRKKVEQGSAHHDALRSLHESAQK